MDKVVLAAKSTHVSSHVVVRTARQTSRLPCRFDEFRVMPPDCVQPCYGEEGMHDTAPLLSLPGEGYDRPAGILIRPFGRYGTG